MAVVVVAPRAHAQIRRAVENWERDHPGERSRLADEVARVLELLADFPDLGIGVGRRGRLLLPDVGYHIYYVHRIERVEVVAVWYARRGRPPQ
ncbi:MAG TPA: type II toxin-antitoxin system RelE/ParE family toxin [Kofleriaceae bacterium]|jgi:plasmid stabilization system protein ParE|nr:type II toxin-antitoxin system RelE/ParE family toxin [Kofleriaceae bacterium]